MCATFHGKPQKNNQAAHKDGNKHNNNATNLRWLTPSENNFEKHLHGTMRTGKKHHAIYKPECMPRGIRHGNAKLNDAAILKIRIDSRPQKLVANDYGVSQSLVSMIKSGAIWNHI